MMDSDLDIARKATTRPVEEVAERLGLGRSDLIYKVLRWQRYHGTDSNRQEMESKAS